jgi:hypothetical protein
VYDWNAQAWNAFLLSSNTATLKTALSWSRKAVEAALKDTSSNAVNYIDTYANLLHKLGDTRYALEWENQALTISRVAQRADKIKEFEKVIRKMQMNEPTWK